MRPNEVNPEKRSSKQYAGLLRQRAKEYSPALHYVAGLSDVGSKGEQMYTCFAHIVGSGSLLRRNVFVSCMISCPQPARPLNYTIAMNTTCSTCRASN